MMINVTYFWEALSWAINILFFTGLLPQIALNYRLKTCNGLSDLMLLGYINGYWALMTYAFVFNLPTAYKIMIPLSSLAVTIIILQRFYYDGFFSRKLSFVFVLNLLFILYGTYATFQNPLFVGSLVGWLSVSIWAIYLLPQMFHIYQAQSTRGFSFNLIAFYALGDCIELAVALAMKFPLQTIVSDLRGISIFLIFCFQFWYYKKT